MKIPTSIENKVNAALEERTRRAVNGTYESVHVVSILDGQILVTSYDSGPVPRHAGEKIVSMMHGLGEGRYWGSKTGFYTRDDVDQFVRDEQRWFWEQLEMNGYCESGLTAEELVLLLS